jgi:SAM-dependent methyltransferase
VPRLFHLDSPADAWVRTPACRVFGWVAGDDVTAFHRMSLVGSTGEVVPLALVDRPDVRDGTPGFTSSGFGGWIDIETAARGPWHLRYEHDGGSTDIPFPLHADDAARAAFGAAKERKLARLRPLLRCPACHAPFADAGSGVRCANGHTYVATRGAYDLLDPATRELVGAFDTPNVSAHGYDPALLELIANANGPIVDIGAGLRPEYREEIVNVEIVGYPTTDVIAASEHLPFADESFALVISVAVLEHVRDPFAAARELMRVMRPGGRIYAAVPFLQPYHGYPDHYYNMTTAGLRNLFAGLDVERLIVPDAGLPIFTLTWMLQWWRRALPPLVREAFDKMTVAELAADPMTLIEEPFVRALPERSNEELAALNLLIARKPA